MQSRGLVISAYSRCGSVLVHQLASLQSTTHLSRPHVSGTIAPPNMYSRPYAWIVSVLSRYLLLRPPWLYFSSLVPQTSYHSRHLIPTVHSKHLVWRKVVAFMLRLLLLPVMLGAAWGRSKSPSSVNTLLCGQYDSHWDTNLSYTCEISAEANLLMSDTYSQ